MSRLFDDGSPKYGPIMIRIGGTPFGNFQYGIGCIDSFARNNQIACLKLECHTATAAAASAGNIAVLCVDKIATIMLIDVVIVNEYDGF
jgi:hypothetical protein